MLVQLPAMGVAICIAASEADLFVRPEHHAHRSLRTYTQLLDEAQRLPRNDASPAVVHRALPDIPGIDVAAHDDDLVRVFGAANLGDHVTRARGHEGARLHL